MVLALGGSASTDGGIGMLAALGYRFLDRAGDLLAPTADNLDRIHCVDRSRAVDLDGHRAHRRRRRHQSPTRIDRRRCRFRSPEGGQ